MNLRIVVALLAAILTLHAMILYFFLASGSSAKTQTGTQDAVPFEPDVVSEMNSEATPFPGPAPIQKVPPSGKEKSGNSAVPSTHSLEQEKAGQDSSSGPSDSRGAFRRNGTRSGAVKEIPETAQARSGFLLDLDAWNVLWEKNEKASVPIASISKLMTLLIAYEAAVSKEVAISLDSPIPVTHEATRIPPSRVDLRKDEVFTLRDLMIAASVRSANDATFLIAQHLGKGREQTFVDRMNERARELGMTNTRFFNSHGLPGGTKNSDNRASAEDTARLCAEFMRHEVLCDWSGLRIADFRVPGQKDYIELQNHNHLLPGARHATPGVTGLKTGFTQRAGFCIAVSCVRDGRRMVLVLTGYPNARARDTAAKKILDWGYRKK